MKYIDIIKRGALIVFAAGTLSGCSDFLDQPIKGENSDNPAYYNDIDNANMAVMACYNALTIEDDMSCFQWVYGDVMSDDAWKGGGGETDVLEITQLKAWQANGDNPFLNATWKAWYKAIARTNLLIERLQSVTFDEKLKKQYIAEAKFIRAYSYLTLVKLYGDIPYFSGPVPIGVFGRVARTPYEEVIANIEKDLTEAAKDLPRSYAAADKGRVTVNAAKALQARTIMYAIGMFKSKPASAWNDVFRLTSEIELSGDNDLLDNYAQIFEAEGENSVESLFEVQYQTSNTGYNFDNTGSSSSIYVASAGIPEALLPGSPFASWGWNFNLPTQILVAEFEPNDPRRECTVYGGMMDLGSGTILGITPFVYGKFIFVGQNFMAPFVTGFSARKLAVDPAIRPSNQSDSPSNQRVIRYADVLLMKAEAAYNIGDEPTARTYVNKIRERARKSTFPKGYAQGTNTYIPTGFSGHLPELEATTTGANLLKAIKHERRMEFAMESLRYWDLVRWGDYESTVTPEVAARYNSSKLRGVPVIPIPTSEVSAWGLTQNPR